MTEFRTLETAEEVDRWEVFCPGAFETFLSGTGAVAGDPYDTDPEMERGAQELRAAYQGSTTFRRGKGYTFGLRLPSIEAVAVLACYAHWCIHANLGGDVDHTEVRAARQVLDRVAFVTGGRVQHDGWNVTLDGRVVS